MMRIHRVRFVVSLAQESINKMMLNFIEDTQRLTAQKISIQCKCIEERIVNTIKGGFQKYIKQLSAYIKRIDFFEYDAYDAKTSHYYSPFEYLTITVHHLAHIIIKEHLHYQQQGIKYQLTRHRDILLKYANRKATNEYIKKTDMIPIIKRILNQSINEQSIISIGKNIIEIYYDKKLVAYAYCFQQNYLVTVCNQLQEDKEKAFQYYLGQEKLKGSFRKIGNFQNLTFIEYNQVQPFNVIPECDFNPKSGEQVEILQKEQYLFLKQGRFVVKDSGYGIINGHGSTNNILIHNGSVFGIIVKCDKENSFGIKKMIYWSKLSKLLQFAKGHKIHLELQAQAYPRREGIQIVRIDHKKSPFSCRICPQDVILSANGHTLRDADSLDRIFHQSDGPIYVSLLRKGQIEQICVHF